VRVRRTAVVLVMLAAACSSAETPAAPSVEATTTIATTTVAPASPVELAECPVDDAAFCATAVDVAAALAARDTGSLVALSRSTTTVCAEMAVEYFLGCADAEVLDGYGLSGPDLLVDVVDFDAYTTAIGSLNTTAGELRMIGVGTCGPDVPGQRTYHLAWMRGTSMGSFELTYEDDWKIALSYSGAKDAWPPDSFCQAARSPW
jgi:hypothetical protein